MILFFILIVEVGYSDDIIIEKDFQEKTYKNPLREFSVIITENGYYPNNLVAYVGERVRFYITTTSKKSECFILQKHEVFISAQKGRLNEGDTLVENSGRYKFYCPASEHKGFLTVFDKNDVKKETATRDIASEPKDTKPRYWTPRDYDE